MKPSGAGGLLLGLLGVPVVGTAAAAGLVLFVVGAVVTHTSAWATTRPRSPSPDPPWCFVAATLAFGLIVD